MHLSRRNPLRDLDSFFHQYHRALGSQNNLSGLSQSWAPVVDITENEQAFVIKAELPEVKKEDIKVQIANGLLTLSGERKQERKDEKEHRIERFYGSFARSFSLPDNVQEDNINAEYKDGMLYLNLPKTLAKKPGLRDVTIN